MAVLQRFGRTSSGNRCSIHLFLQCSWKWMPRCKNGILFLKWKKVYTLEWYHNPANQWERNRRVNGNCALHLMGVWSCPHRACLNAKPAVYCPEFIPARRPHRGVRKYSRREKNLAENVLWLSCLVKGHSCSFLAPTQVCSKQRQSNLEARECWPDGILYTHTRQSFYSICSHPSFVMANGIGLN